MKIFIRSTLICVLLVSLVACNQKISTVNDKNLSAKTEVSTDDILDGLDDKDKSWMNITQAQYVEDFDWLYYELQKNYPYFNVVFRKTGVEIDKAYIEYRKEIEVCTNDDDFVDNVREFVNQMEYVGHISMWGYRYMSEVESMKEMISQFPEYESQLTPYLIKLDNPVSQRNYQAMEEFYKFVDLQVEKANQAIPSNTADLPQESQGDDETPNVETKILRDKQIAYVKINGFDMESYAEDQELLLPFYKSISEYENIIIDITDNSGGGMDYFNDLVVAPLITKPITVSTYMLIKGGQNNREFLKLDNGIAKGEWKAIENLPALPELNTEDLTDMDYFTQEDYTIEPLSEQQSFKGKVWLLVSSINYSSSEYAAMFSKHSGFATLVGEKTGGDGIGVDPAYIILPNSGLVVQYSPVYGVTQDGTGSEEFGTIPDLLSLKGESPITTCMRAIDSDNENIN